jgi:hypothetical protein
MGSPYCGPWADEKDGSSNAVTSPWKRGRGRPSDEVSDEEPWSNCLACWPRQLHLRMMTVDAQPSMLSTTITGTNWFEKCSYDPSLKNNSS